MDESQLNEFCVCERLAAYKFYSNGPVVWKHSKNGLETMCPKPFDVTNPNDYVIPDHLTGGQKRISSNQHQNGWDWWDLHYTIENLARVGWQCFPLSINVIVADDTQLIAI